MDGGDRPNDVAAAKEKQDQGFTAIKMNSSLLLKLQFIDSYEK